MKTLSILLIISGLFLMIGTAGASDLNGIDVKQIITQLVLAFSMIGAGGLKLNKISRKEKRRAARLYALKNM